MQESLRVQEFFLQVDEEEAWIREREPQAGSSDYGKDHSGVVALQQKHQALEAEIQGEGGCIIMSHICRAEVRCMNVVCIMGTPYTCMLGLV